MSEIMDAMELINRLRAFHTFDTGIGKMEEYNLDLDKSLALFAARDAAIRSRIIEECKTTITDGHFLTDTSPEINWARAICKRLDALKEAGE